MVKYLLILSPYLYMVLIWILSSLPSDAIIDTNYSFDNLFKESLHLIEFGILYLLWALSLKLSEKLTLRSNLVIAILSIAYGLIDEIHQAFVPYRSATVIDFVKDTIGVLVAFYFVRKKMKG
ncbi:VanZ family protein [Bacillus sp. Marseille-P3661]|uniref:VanZ family protein n=1 Tax=Bacillus sp. Marseille-P3661 TaxID=1936234 RepID=UPI000C833486|nr:VanZ family protein [Bacillus sp. Marseille-P3661]